MITVRLMDKDGEHYMIYPELAKRIIELPKAERCELVTKEGVPGSSSPFDEFYDVILREGGEILTSDIDDWEYYAALAKPDA